MMVALYSSLISSVAEEGTCLQRKVEEEKCTREKFKAEELRLQRKAEEEKRIEKLVAEKKALAEIERLAAEREERVKGDNNTTLMKENAENATNQQQEKTKSTADTLLPFTDDTAFGYQNNETNQTTRSSRPPIGVEENVYQIVTEGEDIGNTVMNYINLAKLDVYTLQHLRLAMNEQLSASWHQQHPSFLFRSGKVIHSLDKEKTIFVHSGEYGKKIRGADGNGDGSYDHPYVVTIVSADTESADTSPAHSCCVM